MMIRAVTPADLPTIAGLEEQLEGAAAADLATLAARQRIFPAGFLAGWQDGQLLGYIETCRWEKQIPEFKAESDFFGRCHQPQGEILYVIFVGVQPRAQRQGVGRRLLAAVQRLAVAEDAQQVHAVARESLAGFYLGAGFQPRLPLPGFWGEGAFQLMVWPVAEISTLSPANLGWPRPHPPAVAVKL